MRRRATEHVTASGDGRGSPADRAAIETHDVSAAQAAVIFGSGLALVPDGLAVEREIPYTALGWPVGGVAGHGSRLLVARAAARSGGACRAATGAGRGAVVLAFGRSHLYEGRSRAELERPVRDLAAAGVRRLVVMCATGSLAGDLRPGDVVAAHTVVDLQAAPDEEASRLTVCAPDDAARLAAALAPDLAARAGAYVAVAGPQYETPAEAAWLAGFGDVVGMSAVHEVRAALDAGVAVRLLAVVSNRSGADLDHDEVLAAGAGAAAGLRRALARVLGDERLW